MKILIKSATVVDPNSKYHLKRVDVLLENGRIAEIGKLSAPAKCKVVEHDDCYISPGWIDLRANFREPGEEHKESLHSGITAALAGGFRKVVLMPSTQPPVDNKAQIQFLLTKGSVTPVQLLPTGSLSKDLAGKQLSEMYDMHVAGAVAFTDDKMPTSTELLTRALEYTKNFGGLVMTFPHDGQVVPGGMMHEGTISTQLGIKGIPPIAEEIKLQRDIELLRYTGGRMHVSLLSTARSVDLVRKAKKDGLQITCAVAAHQLMYTDEQLLGFDSHYKVLPPYRSKEDRKALINGLKDGTIDAICSDHSPEDIEHKQLEFQDAAFGISSIQSAFCMAYTGTENQLSVADLIQKFCFGPANILGVPAGNIEVGQSTPLTCFTTTKDTLFETSEWKSLSKNSPILGKHLRGRVIPLLS